MKAEKIWVALCHQVLALEALGEDDHWCGPAERARAQVQRTYWSLCRRYVEARALAEALAREAQP